MQIRIWSLLVFLGLAGSFSAAESAIAPLVAQAYTSRVNITLERQPNESFPTLTRRAETVARAAAQRSFDKDILVTQAAVVVTAENGGLSAPILTLEVSRDNWKNYPDARRWSTYYPTAQGLLKIENLVPTAAETTPGQSPTNPTNSSGTGTSANPTATSATTGTNNNPTGTLTSPGIQQTNTQTLPSRSRATYGEGLIRRTRELRDDINNRPPTDLPQD
ncbi:hypothetical protein ACE1B6_00415 [Aerosakkonemataceae cyanobacterium BLCC-F154]|uniref:Uncharacterized protein n=1 Tax=Floridaenema fluviatile BLCC-F154 TaxID=3153640 RepID=A0ABV4Y618_9CYAN